MEALFNDNYFQIFKEFEDKPAIIWRNRIYSYNNIIERINFWKSNLSTNLKDTVVCLEGDFTPETIAILYALIIKKVIICPLDINHLERNKNKYRIAQVQSIIRVNNEDNIEFISTNYLEELNQYYLDLLNKKTPGLVLFTSGSSGEPKAALHDFSKLLKKYEIKRKPFVTINFLLFDHWGGLNTLFHTMSNGGTVVMLENRNPEYVASLIEKYNVELLPASPTFLNMFLLSGAHINKKLKSLKIISYGSEPMPQHLLHRLHQEFPDVILQQTYGLIELGVMRSKSESNDSLWVKIGGEGYETRVVEGILQVKADSAMISYLNAPSPFTSDGWFITGDSVEVKDDYYRILGRKSEMINVGGDKVFPQEVENVILQIPEITDVLVYGEKNPITGMIVCAKIAYYGEKTEKEISRMVKQYCMKYLNPFKVPVKVFVERNSFENDRFKKKRQ